MSFRSGELVVPESLSTTVRRCWGERGQSWLVRLPLLLNEACARWNLGEVVPFGNLTYNFVSKASRDGGHVILKIGVPCADLESEVRALEAYGGCGCAQLLDYDPELSALLIEAIDPGDPLEASWTVEKDKEQTADVARVMLRLWSVTVPASGTAKVYEWSSILANVPSSPLIERARALWAKLEDSPYRPALIHGDLHHGNVLRSNQGCLAIDPNGAIGHPALEIYCLLRNPVQATVEQRLELLDSRIAVVSEVTGLSEEELVQWGFCGLMMAYGWDIEEGDYERPVLAEALANRLPGAA